MMLGVNLFLNSQTCTNKHFNKGMFLEKSETHTKHNLMSLEITNTCLYKPPNSLITAILNEYFLAHVSLEKAASFTRLGSLPEHVHPSC